MLKYSLGLDISSKDIHCCLSVIDQLQHVKVKSSRKVTNSVSGFRNLDSWIKKNHKNIDVPLTICMEATGVYYENCALFLSDQGYQVSVILPNQAKKYLQASGHKSKNDKIDARGLAQMGAEKSLRAWGAMDRDSYTLRLMTRYHESIQEYLTSTKNQKHALLHGMYQDRTVTGMLNKQIRMLEKQRDEILKKISEHISKSSELSEISNKLLTIKGVGLTTVATVLAETNCFQLFENQKQLVSYCGYDPVENQSGKHIGKTKISKKGNSHIRRILFLPAFSVVKHRVKPFIGLFERTLDKHGEKMKSYVAVQKKLLTTLYALWKNNQEFDQEHIWNKNGMRIAQDSRNENKKSVPTEESALHKVNRTGKPTRVSST